MPGAIQLQRGAVAARKDKPGGEPPGDTTARITFEPHLLIPWMAKERAVDR
jgi:hypothetical protein